MVNFCHLEMQFPCCENDMLSGLLLEGLYCRIGLTKEFESFYELRQID